MRHEFTVHKLTDVGFEKATTVAKTFETALDKIEELVGGDGREMAIVRTKMEEACFFAKKALASRPENQEE